MSVVKTRYFEEVSIGEAISPISFHVDLFALIRYAGATWDFHPYHYDAALMQRLGMAAPVADGQMLGALIARMMMSWGGADAFLRNLRYRLRTPVFVGDTINVSGHVTFKSRDGGIPTVGAHVSITKDNGSLVVRDATAIIELTSTGRSVR